MAVLRGVAVGDVELGHDLESRADRGCERERGLEGVDEHAVDAEADDELVLHGVNVDVRGASAEGLEQDHVHQADDGRLPGELEEVGGVADASGGGLDGGGVEGHFLDDLGDEVLLLLVAAVDEVDDRAARGEDEADGHAELVFKDVEDGGLHGLRGGAGHDVAVGGEAGDEAFAGHGRWNELIEASGGLGEAGFRVEGEARAAREFLQSRVLVDGEHGEQDVPGFIVGAGEIGEGLELFGLDLEPEGAAVGVGLAGELACDGGPVGLGGLVGPGRRRRGLGSTGDVGALGHAWVFGSAGEGGLRSVWRGGTGVLPAGIRVV